MPGFGRLVAEDSRDKKFLMRRALIMIDALEEPRLLPMHHHFPTGPILDQGSTGTCVAHGWAARIAMAPIMQKLPMSPFDFYRLIVRDDEFTDNDAETTAPDAALQ